MTDTDSRRLLKSVLPAEHARVIHGLAAALTDEWLPISDTLTTRNFQEGLRQLPESLRRHLDDFRRGDTGPGAALIRGFIVGDIPETPSKYQSDALERHPTAIIAALIAEYLGLLFAYADEQHGALVQDVYPIAGDEDRIMGSGARLFDLHTENVHHELRPHYLGLLCLRADPGQAATTLIASARETVSQLDQRTREILSKPLFVSKVPLSFLRDAPGPRPESPPHPVITMDDEGVTALRCNTNHTYGLNEPAQQALHRLNAAARTVKHHVHTRPGDLLLLDNRRVMHGRAHYTPRHDGADRWLRRFYSRDRIPSHLLTDGTRVVK